MPCSTSPATYRLSLPLTLIVGGKDVRERLVYCPRKRTAGIIPDMQTGMSSKIGVMKLKLV